MANEQPLNSNEHISPLAPPSPQGTSGVLPGVITILVQAWSIYKQRLGTFVGIMMIPVALMVLSDVFDEVRSLQLTLLSSESSMLGIGFLLFLSIILFLAALLAQVWGATALLYAIKESQEDIGVIEAYRRGWKKIFSYWWLSFLMTFIIIGGLFLLVVPAIIFSTWFSFAIIILIVEDLKGMNALLKSREYVRGRWLSIFWRSHFIIILLAVSYLVVEFILGLTTYGEYLVPFIIGLVCFPIAAIYGFSLYRHVKSSSGEIAFSPNSGQKTRLVIVGILGALFLVAGLFFIAFFGSGEAREELYKTQRETEMRQIQTALELYYYENERYPLKIEELSPQFFPTIPVDPETNIPYEYQQRGDNDYQLCVQLESETQNCVTSES